MARTHRGKISPSRSVSIFRFSQFCNWQFAADSFLYYFRLLPVFSAVTIQHNQTIFAGLREKIAAFQAYLTINALYVKSCGIAAGFCGKPQFYNWQFEVDRFLYYCRLLPVFSAVTIQHNQTIFAGLREKIAVFQSYLTISILYVTSCGIAAGIETPPPLKGDFLYILHRQSCILTMT